MCGGGARVRKSLAEGARLDCSFNADYIWANIVLFFLEELDCDLDVSCIKTGGNVKSHVPMIASFTVVVTSSGSPLIYTNIPKSSICSR